MSSSLSSPQHQQQQNVERAALLIGCSGVVGRELATRLLSHISSNTPDNDYESDKQWTRLIVISRHSEEETIQLLGLSHSNSSSTSNDSD